MQLTRQEVKVIEKVISTENGLFLARFAIVNSGGTLRARLMEMVPMPEQSSASISATTLLLESPIKSRVISFVEPEAREIVSPFTELFFLTSQPTRAPSLFA